MASSKPTNAIPWYTIYLVGLLLIAYTLSFIDRQILSLLVEPMKRDLSINDTQMSLLQGMSFALFYTIMGLPLGRMADSHSRRKLIGGGIFIWSLMTAVCGLAKNYSYLFAARMGVGIGEAALSPAAYSLISDSVETKHMATAISIYTMGIYLGGGLALILGGFVINWAYTVENIQLPYIGQLYSWQWVFLCVGIPGLLLAPLMLTIKEPQRRGLAIGQQASAVPVAEVITYFKTHRKTLALSTLAAAFASLAGYGNLAWVPTFLIRSHGMDGYQAGLSFGLIVLFCGAGGVLSGGILADKWSQKGVLDAKLRVAMIAGLAGILPTMLFPLASTTNLVLVLLAIATYSANFMMGLGPAAIQEIVPSTMRGQFSAAYLFTVNLIGLGLGPTAVAIFTDFVLKDSKLLLYSLAIVPTVALGVSTFLLWKCLPHYRKTFKMLAPER